MTTVVIVVALVVAAIVAYLAFARGRLGAGLQSSQAPTRPEIPPRTQTLPAKELPRPAASPAAAPAPKPPPPSSQAKLPEARLAAVEPPAPPAQAPGTTPTARDVAGLRKGLAATRGGFIAKLAELFHGKKDFDPAILEQLEEVMLASDVGPKTTHAILSRLRDALGRNELRDGDSVWAALRSEAARILTLGGGPLQMSTKPSVVLVVGVNGVGKTTTIGKLATHYAAANKKVLLAAGDTFRAAAVQQLEIWGKRIGVDVVRGKDGADPGAVAFDATLRAREAQMDLLLIDTAGRLHTKVPLMDEIKKVRKTIAKALDGAPHETLLVLDATTGQNALQQAAMFRDALDLTGIVLTKLDGTAKGGIVLAICDELHVPVRYVGLGERADDLREFHAEEFVEALFGRGEEEVAAA